MDNTIKKKLALDLMTANEEHEVVDVLKRYNLWDDRSQWKNIGGENTQNIGVANNQQQKPLNALVEKIVNSTDAILMRECIKNKINPESKEAPQSPLEARKKLLISLI